MKTTQIAPAALVIILGVLMFAVLYVPDIQPLITRQADGTITLGSAEIPSSARARIVALIATDAGGITDGNYDTLQSPVGTNYAVPAAVTLFITGLTVGAGAAGVVVELGYGDDAVNDSASAPSAAVVLYEQTLGAAQALAELDVFGQVPAGKLPYMRVTGAGAWRAMANGYTAP